MKRFLITTALEETWRDDVPVLFLGEWCQRYSRRSRWSVMDAEVVPYHWDDRTKLRNDYRYLRDFHERLLNELTSRLNEIHGIDRSVRYWRILIGPWLGYFTQILLDRWTSIEQALRQSELSDTVVLGVDRSAAVPYDMADFSRLFHGDEWNHHLYAAILADFTDVPCTTRQRPSFDHPIGRPSVNGTRLVRSALASLYSRAAEVLSRNDDAFFVGTSLGALDEMRLYRRLGQMPQRWRAVSPPAVPADVRQRRWVLSGDSRSKFEDCARSMIPRQMPTIYLEGYPQLLRETERLPWPHRPAVIWTSHAERDDVFLAWAAEKVERGTPLVISQHGGHYGVGLWSSHEDHEIAISDRYLSWGWSDPAQPKISPVGQITSRRPLNVRHGGQPGALLVTATVPRYSYWMYSVMVGRQWLDYFDDQCAFVESLSTPVREALTVRLYAADYGWDQRERWTDRFPDVRLDAGWSNIADLVRQSRLYIATYNATTFLESFAMNVPTVIFWNPNHWELRDSAIPYFDDLKRVGIFHDTPVAAAHHISAIWDDVDAWWTRPDVRAAVDRFKAQYCTVPDDLLGRLEGNLREMMGERASARVGSAGA